MDAKDSIALSALLALRQEVRNYEADLVADLLPSGAMVLEIGAGAGWQMKRLAERGFQVTGVDLPPGQATDELYVRQRCMDVTSYDGHTLPFPDRGFDVVFSSNVLEHVPHLVDFQREMRRVLKDKGLAVHVLPSGSWRFWTILANFPIVLIAIIKGLRRRLGRPPPAPSIHARAAARSAAGLPAAAPKVTWASRLNSWLPHRHGERGNVVSEIYYFSASWWRRFFSSQGWQVQKYRTNGLYYLGSTLSAPVMSIQRRRQLSRVLGSSSHIFVLRK